MHGRRLAGAVRAEEAVDLAGGDVQVDAVDGARALLELPDQPPGLDCALVAVHAATLPGVTAVDESAHSRHAWGQTLSRKD